MPNANDVYRALKEADVPVLWKPEAPLDLKSAVCLVYDSDEMVDYGTDVTGQAYIDVDVCVPSSYYGTMNDQVKRARDALKTLPGLVYNGTSYSWFDDNMRAMVRTLEYRVSKRNR